MGSTRDFLVTAMSDAMLPLFKVTLEDVLLETLNDRKVPTRTDFQELRDVVNRMRGQTSSAQNAATRADKQLAALEARVAVLEARLVALEEPAAAAPAARKKATTKKATAKKATAKKNG